MTKRTKSTGPRRIKLACGGVKFDTDTLGNETATVVVTGESLNGRRYEARVEVDAWWMGRLAAEIREHFTKLAETEKKIRDYRERAFRTPLGGAS